MSFEIKKACRKNTAPLIVLYSESGCGKTYSALLLARGLVGPSGKIRVVDSECGRASLYADISEFGGYEVVNFEEPFTPARYVEALNVARNGADVAICDSGSHEWEGVGGVLDMAMENEKESRRAGLHNWRIPKMEHSKFVLSLMRSSIPVIVCLRAKYKTRQGKDNGKTVIVKDEFTTPIQAEDFIFEATFHGEIMPDHSLRITKSSHPSLRACFDDGKPITLANGQKLAAWCRGESTIAPDESVKALKKELWTLTKSFHMENQKAFRQYLIDDCGLDPAQPIETLTAEQLKTLIEKVRSK